MRKNARFVKWVRLICALCVLVVATGTATACLAANFTEADVVRDIGYAPMKNGMRIAYVSYRPKTGHYPTVFLYSPYTGDATTFDVAKGFLDAGYAFVGANFSATGCSEGVIDTWVDGFDPIVGRDGAEVVEWIAKQPWSDGKVGMVGNSSLGTLQFWVAAEHPPHLRALVASGVEDGYDDWLSVGGMLQINSTIDYALQTTFDTQGLGAQWRISRGDKECAAIRGSKRQVLKQSFADEVRKHPLKDAWWDAASLAREGVAGQVTVPTMLIGGWQDQYGGTAREGAQLFANILKKTAFKKILLMNGDHGIAGPGEGGYGFIDQERIRFLDRWLKGDKNGIDNEPPVTVYWEVRQPPGDSKKAVAGWVTRHSTWPEPKVERRPFYLTANARISPDKPGATPNNGARAYVYPMGTELVGNNKQFAVIPSEDGVLNYRTAPAASDMTLLGNPDVTLYLSIDSGDDADLALTLKDVDPDGNVLYLQSGLLRASLRAIDEKRSYADEVVPLYSKSDKLVPGRIYKVHMSLLSPIAHVVRKGHSLELTIGAPNPIPHPFASIPAGTASINSIYHSQMYPSQIVLPILPGAVAQAPAPECGTLRNQPCRKEVKFSPGGASVQ